MPTVIRFARFGSKQKPFFRIVVQDSRQKRDGRFIERLGTFDPLKGLNSLSIVKPRLEYWLSVGAQMSDSVRTTLRTTLAELRNQTARPARASKKPAEAAPADK